MSKYLYKILPTHVTLQLMDWATENNVDYDVWNAAESISGTSPNTELGLERWPGELSSVMRALDKLVDGFKCRTITTKPGVDLEEPPRARDRFFSNPNQSKD